MIDTHPLVEKSCFEMYPFHAAVVEKEAEPSSKAS
jgi:hypothetical protein